MKTQIPTILNLGALIFNLVLVIVIIVIQTKMIKLLTGRGKKMKKRLKMNLPKILLEEEERYGVLHARAEVILKTNVLI